MTTARPTPGVRLVRAPGTWHPTPLQELLLDAALDEDPGRAESAFERWVDRNGFDAFDAGSYRVLPLVAHRAASFVGQSRWSGHLRGVLRRSWFENQIVLHNGLRAVDVLQRSGLAVVVFKGAALGATVYEGLGVRPMDDLDLLVPEDRAADALRVLLAAGWELGDDAITPALHRGEVPEAFRGVRAGVSLHHSDGSSVDLHWHATHAWCWPGADAGLWGGISQLELLGRRVGRLTSGDELIVSCVHGLRPNDIPPIRWVADAALLVRHGSVEWGDLITRARALLVEPFVVQAFDYLRSRFDAPIPAWVVAGLRQRRVGYLERRWFESRLDDGENRSLAAHYGGYLRSVVPERGLRRYAGGLPEHLVYLLGCESARDLPAEIGRRAASRTGLRKAGGNPTGDGRPPSS
jgi:hypothetical protein